MEVNNNLKLRVTDNLSKVDYKFVLIPIALLILTACFFVVNNIFSVEGYVSIQKNAFFYLNKNLSQLTNLQFNLTQLGDALVFLSILSVFFIYLPKLWEALLSSLIITGLVTFPLKKNIFGTKTRSNV